MNHPQDNQKKKPSAGQLKAGLETGGRQISTDKVFVTNSAPLVKPTNRILEPTNLQETAHALYSRGFNVFPLPPPYELTARAELTGADLSDKPAYSLWPIQANRLHLCGPECLRREDETGRPCLPESARFMSLFDRRANLGVMLGATSGNLIQIDCDTPKIAAAIETWLDIPHWSYTTSRGKNFLLRIQEGEVANQPDALFGCEVYGRRRYAVIPPSIHAQTGTLYTWGTVDPVYMPSSDNLPAVSINALDWLGIELYTPQLQQAELYGLPEWTRELSDSNRRILVTAHEEGIRNRSLTPAVYDVAALIDQDVITYTQGAEVLITAAANCIPPYPRRTIENMLKSALNKRDLAPAKGTATPPPWVTAERWEQAHTWTGRTALIDRAVFMAMIQRSKIEGATFRASCRELAELANTTYRTAWKATKRLIDAKLIRVENQDKDKKTATRYTWGTVLNYNINYQLINTVVIKHTPNNQLSTPEKDVFGKLGRVGYHVWSYLLEHPAQTKSEIARGARLNRSSVSRSIPKLIQWHLVEYSQAEGLYIGLEQTQERLEVTSAYLGTLGRADRRARQHQTDRERRANLVMAQERRKWINRYLEYLDRNKKPKTRTNLAKPSQTKGQA